MNEFDDLKKLWQTSATPLAPVDAQALRRTNASQQQKLAQTQLLGAILLLLTSAYLVYLGFFIDLGFQAPTTYGAVALLALLSAGQGLVGLYLYRRLRRIDVSAPVTQHLHQWETYYAFRQRLIRINLPLYYLLLNGAFALYFIEILGKVSLMFRLIALTIYVAWMLFAWFVLGKRSLQREESRLTTILDNLRQQQVQLNSD